MDRIYRISCQLNPENLVHPVSITYQLKRAAE
jgi:hypothetical protein